MVKVPSYEEDGVVIKISTLKNWGGGTKALTKTHQSKKAL